MRDFIPTNPLKVRLPSTLGKPVWPVAVQRRIDAEVPKNIARVVLYGTALAGLVGLVVGLEGCKLAARLIG